MHRRGGGQREGQPVSGKAGRGVKHAGSSQPLIHPNTCRYFRKSAEKALGGLRLSWPPLHAAQRCYNNMKRSPAEDRRPTEQMVEALAASGCPLVRLRRGCFWRPALVAVWGTPFELHPLLHRVRTVQAARAPAAAWTLRRAAGRTLGGAAGGRPPGGELTIVASCAGGAAVEGRRGFLLGKRVRNGTATAREAGRPPESRSERGQTLALWTEYT